MKERVKQIKTYAGLKVPNEIEVSLNNLYQLELIPHCEKAKGLIEYLNKNPNRKYENLLEALDKAKSCK